MNFVLAIILFLLGGVSVIALEVFAVASFFDEIRALLQGIRG
jgi:hypothetical protein